VELVQVTRCYRKQWKKYLRTLEGNFTSASACGMLTMLLLVSSSSIEADGTGGGTESLLVMSTSESSAASKFSAEKYQHIQHFKNE